MDLGDFDDRAEMGALRHRDPDDVDHAVPFEQDLLVIEPKHDIAARDQARIGGDVPSAVGGTAVVGEPIDLDDERPADETVDRVPVDPDLLPHRYSLNAHAVDEVRLKARV